jgi:hypothetical protein
MPHFDLNSGGCPAHWDLDAWVETEFNPAPWSADLPVLARGEAVTDGHCNCFIYDRMAQRPAVLENPVFELLGVLEVESGLEPSKRGLTSDYLFNFLQDFEAILDHELYSPLREVIHLLSADPEERLPGKFSNTHQPGLFASEEFDAVSLLLSQKLLQGDRVAVGIAKVPVRLAIDFWFSCRGHSPSLQKPFCPINRLVQHWIA